MNATRVQIPTDVEKHEVHPRRVTADDELCAGSSRYCVVELRDHDIFPSPRIWVIV